VVLLLFVVVGMIFLCPKHPNGHEWRMWINMYYVWTSSWQWNQSSIITKNEEIVFHPLLPYKLLGYTLVLSASNDDGEERGTTSHTSGHGVTFPSLPLTAKKEPRKQAPPKTCSNAAYKKHIENSCHSPQIQPCRIFFSLSTFFFVSFPPFPRTNKNMSVDSEASSRGRPRGSSMDSTCSIGSAAVAVVVPPPPASPKTCHPRSAGARRTMSASYHPVVSSMVYSNTLRDCTQVHDMLRYCMDHDGEGGFMCDTAQRYQAFCTNSTSGGSSSKLPLSSTRR
jgi:hypothetical protein